MRRSAEVIANGIAGYDAAELQARELAAAQHPPSVSPFDDRLVTAGDRGTILSNH